jgi:thioredoxin reductase (NADPH)
MTRTKGKYMTNHTKVLIIGAGPAGYTAAIYAARANLHPIQILGPQPGGQLTITTDVENYPGFKDVIQGPWLMEQMQAQAAHVGTDMRFESVVSVDFSNRPFTVTTDAPTTYTADAVIIATGAQARWLGLESETHFRGYGISGCATCDGFFFKDKNVAVIGGGNSAVEEAIYLTNHCAHVTLIHRRDQLRAEKIAQDRLFKNPKISVIWDSAVEEFLGVDQPVRSLTGLKLKNLKTQAISEHKFDGAFVAIGHTPMSDPFKGQLACDNEGYIITTPGSTVTSVAGVYAAGDVQDKIFRQAVTAAGQGCMAALEAEKFVNH